MKLFIKPFLLTGIKEHGGAPAYCNEPDLQRKGSINGTKVTFVRARDSKQSYRVSFEWNGKWFFIDNNIDLYELVKLRHSRSKFLDFYVD
ncbi:MAG TPA: hypothetical protein PKA82_12920 [Pyrinomonadaceae bacterium]|nr:hypothetical protein [Pyrinomonadaceae bacterium]